MILPYKSLAPRRKPAIITWLLIAANVAIWLAVAGDYRAGIEQRFIYGMTPDRLAQGWNVTTLLTYGFIHAGWAHLITNMIALFAFGPPVESRMGHFGYGLFFLVSIVLAGLAHLGATGDSGIGLVGASGGVAAVMGLHLMLFPHVKIRTLIMIFPFSLHSLLVIGFWVFSQFSGIAQQGSDAGIAFEAHLGGFAAGVLMGMILKKLEPPLIDYNSGRFENTPYERGSIYSRQSHLD